VFEGGELGAGLVKVCLTPFYQHWSVFFAEKMSRKVGIYGFFGLIKLKFEDTFFGLINFEDS
jgi:hypothetical protein